jgi:predicted RNase H-like HicB family nuclease
MNQTTGCTMELTAHVHREGGSYWADVPELPGCFASGDTLDELFDSLREGIELYLAEDDSHRGAPSGPLHITTAVLTDTAPA